MFRYIAKGKREPWTRQGKYNRRYNKFQPKLQVPLKVKSCMYIYSRGATWGARPLHLILWLRICLLIEAQHIFTNIPGAPSQIFPVAPLISSFRSSSNVNLNAMFKKGGGRLHMVLTLSHP